MESQASFFVTGSTGFIGRRLVNRLVSEFGPRSVVCLTRVPSRTVEARALEAQRALGLRVIESDLLEDPVSVERPPGQSVVFHLAANVDTSATEHRLRVNDVGTQHLLEWLRAGASDARIVYTSTVAVHDRNARPIGPLSETSPCVPRTAYGRSKLRGEAVVQASCAGSDCSWTILRLPTVYGPGQKASGLFETLAGLAARRAWLGRLDWPGRTSIIHVDDAVDAMIDLGTRPEAAGEAYGVASDESPTVGEIAREIAGAIGQPIEPIAVAPPVWDLARFLVWNRALQALIPPQARVACWRLSLVIDDGFWLDTTKFRGVYSKPLRNLRQGLADTFVPRRGLVGSP